MVFLSYHYRLTTTLTWPTIVKTFWYGWHLDASFAAYLCILPFIGFLLETLLPAFRAFTFIRIYTGICVFVISLLSVLDLELYRAWGFRLDTTILQYVNTPAEMLASASGAPVGRLTGILILLFGLLLFIFLWFIQPYLYAFSRIRTTLRTQVISLLCLILLVIPLRGSSWHVPLNQSAVYFSNSTFANHAAINVPWNVLYYLTLKDAQAVNHYNYFPYKKARLYVDSLYHTPSAKTELRPTFLKNTRPNVLFIILESYSAKLVGCLGGESGVTPNIDSMAQQGLLFKNIYASGDRSEKGLVALLSGYPVQTTTSIIKLPPKTEHLPHLSKLLKKQGYTTSYYYGGDLAFANIKSYLRNAGYERLISKYDFNTADYNSKWGVHDHVLLKKWLADLKNEKQPFFSTLFTLSSHEPYDIPIPARFPGSDEATLFKNSVHYTDQAIGDFIRAANKQAWWPNTLVVLVADHGHRLPGNDPNYKASKFRIPLLFTGGALKQAYPPVTLIGSQTDVVPTILHQMHLPADSFIWGKDLLNPVAKSFAFYAFNNGFGFVTPAGVVTYDNIAKKVISPDKAVSIKQLNTGKAYMQLSFDDYLKK